MSRAPACVLLVEDDPAHAEIVRRHFEASRLATRLIHVPDGQEALDFLYRRDRYREPESSPRPALVLLDLRLPRVDGLEVLRTVKTDPALRTIPVVVLSTSAAADDVARALENHANSYLVKPADYPRFLDLLETLGYYWLAWNRHPS